MYQIENQNIKNIDKSKNVLDFINNILKENIKRNKNIERIKKKSHYLFFNNF